MLIFSSIIAASLTVSGATKKSNNLTKEPNFVFILADDMGWTGTSIPSIKGDKTTKSDFYETPNLERLAKYGMTFSNAYAPAAMCTPSRASLLTGKTCARLRMTTPGPVQTSRPYYKVVPGTHLTDLPTKELTIAEALKESGYKTAHFGKWHLKGDGPGKHGFDIHDGETENARETFPADNPKDMFGITQRSIDFMNDCKSKKKPFYVQLSHYAVHTECESLSKTKSYFDTKKSGQRHTKTDLAAMTKDFDTTVGLIMDYLKESGLYQNTFLIFMSDNGAPNRKRGSENYPLHSGKGALYEGGVRVPMIVAGPYVKSNSYCDKNVIGYDIFPTIWTLAKLDKKSYPKSCDGLSLVRPLRGLYSDKFKSRSLIFHNPHYGNGPQVPQSAMIVGDMKVLKDYDADSFYYYNLSKDIGESKDLKSSQKSTANKLNAKLEKYLKDVNASLPTKNNDYNASAKRSRNRFISRFDKNGDAKISKDEFKGPIRKFDQLDKNSDGFIDESEAPNRGRQ